MHCKKKASDFPVPSRDVTNLFYSVGGAQNPLSPSSPPVFFPSVSSSNYATTNFAMDSQLSLHAADD